MTTRSHHPRAQRRLDLASLALLLCGLVTGAFVYRGVMNLGDNPLYLVPSIVAATIGALNLTKWVAPRD